MTAQIRTSRAQANRRRTTAKTNSPLSGHVRQCIERYFNESNGQHPSDLYEMVLSEIEQPLLEVVMQQTRGNISKAAEFLGLNRATLRKKLQKYGLNG